MTSQPRVLPHAPAELTGGRLQRLGEGIGKVVYASDHWVVKRERSPSAILALILLWKLVRRVEQNVPGGFGRKLLRRPSRQIRFLRVMVQGVVLVVPRSFWVATHAWQMWTLYTRRDVRGERLAETHLEGTKVMPETIEFPPVRVAVGGWPGWLTVSEATERVEGTLYQKLLELARAGRYEEMEVWLNRFLELRQAGWQRGVFSVDAHLKNFGVTGERVVLLDTGGLTNDWKEIEKRLRGDSEPRPAHRRLGLAPLLRGHPELAARFDAKWNETVNYEEVRRNWPESAKQ
jgi:hypothetical protein